MEIKVNTYTEELLEKLDKIFKRYKLRKSFNWLLDDTLHLCASYISNNNRYYTMTIFNNLYMSNFYIQIKCGNWLTRVNLHTFKPLTSEYKTIKEFIDFMESGEYRKF